MKTLCYSVRLESLVRISRRTFRATAIDGSSDIIPVSTVFGMDYTVRTRDAYWISAWILEQKNIHYSKRKPALFDNDRRQLPTYTIERNTPEKKEAKKCNEIETLKR